MPASADSLRLALIKEVVTGQVPASPVYEEMRITGESISFAYNSTASNELGGTGRGVRDSILTGGQAQGDLNFELHKDPALEDLLAAMLGSHWGDDPRSTGLPGDDFVYVNDKMQTFTIEKRWTISESDYNYHRYHGLTPNTLALTITPNEPITGTIGFLGTDFQVADDEDTGSTYTAAPLDPVMTAPLVTSITLYDAANNPVIDIGVYCFTSLVVNLTNNDRGIACIGYLGMHETVFGRFEGTINYSLLYASDFPLEALQSQEDLKLIVEMRDAPGNNYTLLFPRVRFATAVVAAGGTGQDVLVTGDITALVGQPPNEFSLLIRRGVPGPVTATDVVAVDQLSATITIAGGPADAAGSVGVTVTTTGSTIAPVTVPVEISVDKYEISRRIAAALNGPNLLATARREVVELALAGTTTAISNVVVTVT